MGKMRSCFGHVKLRSLQDIQVRMEVGNCICESRTGHEGLGYAINKTRI